MHTCMHAYIHTHIHTHIHVHTYVHAYTHTYLHTHMHTHIHTYIHSTLRTSSTPAVACASRMDPTFGQRAQCALTFAPKSGVCDSEHVSASTGDKIPLVDGIATLKATGNGDTRIAEILAAATTLHDSRGRDRKAALRKMANAWGESLKEKVGGRYEQRPNSALADK